MNNTNSSLRVQSPADFQVFQRDQADEALIRIVVTSQESVSYRFTGPAGPVGDWKPSEASDSTFIFKEKLTTGGPYTLEVQSGNTTATVRGLLVGDIWLLAGHSNMDGCGHMVDLEPPHPMVHAYYYDETWGIAKDPLCVLHESIYPIHHADIDLSERVGMAREYRELGTAGAGLGVRFGKDLYKATNVPVGLLMASHGGTSLAQWAPALKSLGGSSLYGATMERIRTAGGNIAGCLWYQGESDALEEGRGEDYLPSFQTFLGNLRADTERPHLPIITVQLGPFFVGDDPAVGLGWDNVRRAQLIAESQITNVALIPNGDCSLSDAIHADAKSLRRLGARMALAARKLHFREEGIHLGPRPKAATFTDSGKTAIRVTFTDIQGQLNPPKDIKGFTVFAGDQRLPTTSTVVDKNSRNAILITLRDSATSSVTLWHARGVNPVVNIHDSSRIPAPFFGPLEVK